MIMSGLVTVKSGELEIPISNHIVNTGMRMVLSMILSTGLITSGSSGLYAYLYLPGNASRVQLGSGGFVPSFSVTALQALVVNTPAATCTVASYYSTTGGIDVFYTGSIIQTSLQAAFQIITGTAQAGGPSTITLATGASGSDDAYNSKNVTIASGTGAGQVRAIVDYTGSSKVADVDTAWLVEPDNTSVYVVYTPVTEIGLQCYGGGLPTTYQWYGASTGTPIGNAYHLMSYISATGGGSDFGSKDIDVAKALTVEWRLRLAFAAD